MCVIRLENIVSDIKFMFFNSGNATFKKHIVRGLKDVLKEENQPFYSVNDKEDIIFILQNSNLNGFAIRDMVEEYEGNETKSEFFYLYGDSYEFYSIEDFDNLVDKHCEKIAKNILLFPFLDVYKDLYKEFVVPMVIKQME